MCSFQRKDAFGKRPRRRRINGPSVYRSSSASLEHSAVAQAVFGLTRAEDRKFVRQKALTLETAHLENMHRSRIAGMTQRIQSLNPQVAGDSYDCAQGFCRVTAAPRVLSQDVAGRGYQRCLESQACRAEQSPARSGLDEVWPGGPALPFGLAVSKKQAGWLDGAMTRPAAGSGHFRIGRIAVAHILGVRGRWHARHQPP